jgi:hypothetical protein
MSTQPPETATSNGVRFADRYPNVLYYLIAAICVALLIVEVTGMRTLNGVTIAVLVGLTLLALLAPNIESLTIGKDGVVAALKKGIAENSNKIDATKTAAREIDTQLDQKITQIFEELKALRLGTAPRAPPSVTEITRDPAKPKIKPITDENDPQRGRFGGKEESNGRLLSAMVEPSTVNPKWCKVEFKVARVGNASPLTGNVEFYLHDTFRPDHYTVPVLKGEATLSLRAVGAFTAGAVADDGHTLLELDLEKSENVVAPADWRAR